MTSLLLLGGTTEATALAHRLAAERPDVDVLLSLAGRVARPAEVPVERRLGGFGGVDGLVDHLRERGHGLVVDATHPFAAVMPFHAQEAADVVGLPRLRVLRPPWEPAEGDRWIDVPDLPAAVDAIDALGARRPFLAIGRQHVAAFATSSADRLLVRSVDAPDALPDGRFAAVLDRGPFSVDDERALLEAHGIDVVVTRNAGGSAAQPKLTAARELGLPVIVIRRPPQPDGPTAPSADDAMTWIAEQLEPRPRPTLDPEDLGGDPACWAHLVEDDGRL